MVVARMNHPSLRDFYVWGGSNKSKEQKKNLKKKKE